MNPVTEVQLTCLRELRRNLRSAKGLIMGVLFLLGGGATSLMYVAISKALRSDASAEVPTTGRVLTRKRSGSSKGNRMNIRLSMRDAISRCRRFL